MKQLKTDIQFGFAFLGLTNKLGDISAQEKNMFKITTQITEITIGSYFISNVDVSSPGDKHLQTVNIIPRSCTVQWRLIVLQKWMQLLKTQNIYYNCTQLCLYISWYVCIIK